MKIITKCKCGNEISTTEERIKEGRGKFCSQSCKYKYREMPKRGKGNYKLVKENPTSFKKGHKTWNEGTIGLMIAWNKGTKGIMKPNQTSFKEGVSPWNKDKEYELKEKVGYAQLHDVVKKRRGKAVKCEHCGTDKGRIEWANKSHEYKREMSDWISLCKKCHCQYDKNHWGLATQMFNLNKKVCSRK